MSKSELISQIQSSTGAYCEGCKETIAQVPKNDGLVIWKFKGRLPGDGNYTAGARLAGSIRELENPRRQCSLYCEGESPCLERQLQQ